MHSTQHDFAFLSDHWARSSLAFSFLSRPRAILVIGLLLLFHHHLGIDVHPRTLLKAQLSSDSSQVGCPTALVIYQTI